MGRAVDRIPVQNFHKGSDSIMIDFTKKPCVFSPWITSLSDTSLIRCQTVPSVSVTHTENSTVSWWACAGINGRRDVDGQWTHTELAENVCVCVREHACAWHSELWRCTTIPCLDQIVVLQISTKTLSEIWMCAAVTLTWHSNPILQSNIFMCHFSLWWYFCTTLQCVMNVSPHQVWLQKIQCFISSWLTLMQILNVCCDLDLRNSHIVFSLDTLVYDDLPSN